MLSRQQQELVCLRAAHVDCPRYRRGVAPPKGASRGPIQMPAVPPAIAASLVVLALSAGISFGFVVQRGGIDLPPSAPPGGAAVVATPTAAIPTSTPVPTAATTPSAAPTETPPATPPPTASATPSQSATPVSSPTPASSAAPSPTPAASGVPSASRLAVLKPCPGQKGCYIYTVRSGDNLFSIARWFGVPLATIYAWNPAVQHGISPGDQIRIPTPTR